MAQKNEPVKKIPLWTYLRRDLGQPIRESESLVQRHGHTIVHGR